jgi:hypothetical protein
MFWSCKGILAAYSALAQLDEAADIVAMEQIALTQGEEGHVSPYLRLNRITNCIEAQLSLAMGLAQPCKQLSPALPCHSTVATCRQHLENPAKCTYVFSANNDWGLMHAWVVLASSLGADSIRIWLMHFDKALRRAITPLNIYALL